MSGDVVATFSGENASLCQCPLSVSNLKQTAGCWYPLVLFGALEFRPEIKEKLTLNAYVETFVSVAQTPI